MTKVPPTPGSPIPSGGILLNTPQAPPPTQHKTVFHGCALGLFVMLDENNVCQGYKLLIQDPRESRTYEADFVQDLKDQWLKDLSNFPNVGEVPEGIQNDGQVV